MKGREIVPAGGEGAIGTDASRLTVMGAGIEEEEVESEGMGVEEEEGGRVPEEERETWCFGRIIRRRHGGVVISDSTDGAQYSNINGADDTLLLSPAFTTDDNSRQSISP